MKRVATLLVLLFTAIPVWAGPAVVEKHSVPLASVRDRIPCAFFQPDFLHGDSNYHSLVSASDGNLYFSIDTHNTDYACRFYRFDPKTETMTTIAAMDAPAGEDATREISQGKIHVPFYEHGGKLYFATHLSFYQDGLPGYDAGGKPLYQGGLFMSYDLASGDFETLARVLPDEGIITCLLDPKREVLYGLTWPSALLVSYDLKAGALHSWGAVQGRGEWGHHPEEWDRVCRTLALEPNGNLYGSTMDGRIWRFEPDKRPRPLSYIEGLDLKQLTFSQSAKETLKGNFQYNWRVVEWNPATESFFGVQWETTALFEFVPDQEYLRALCDFRHDAYKGMPRNPEISQLGFVLAPDNNTILYLANGPAVTVPGRPEVQSGLWLLTYDIAAGTMKNHGLVIGPEDRRPFFTESLVIGADERLYTVAWTEVIDPARRAQIGEARAFGPEETERMVYEIQLVRLPKWRKFAR
ncbi:MAG: hypothetical protein KF886_17765 [Candidatus Hydrogenedentes bacterium]|nr:hypothetical protein [Candidatus Hydrogenedentota bacterium]